MGAGARDWRNGDLEGCRRLTFHEAGITAEDVVVIADAIAANGTEITWLDVSDSDLHGEGAGMGAAAALGQLLSAPLYLEEVMLERNGLGPEDATHFAKSLMAPTCPARLRLGGNQLGPDGAAALAASLSAVGSGVRELDLQRNAIGDAGATAMADALRSDPPLHSLNLDENGIGAAGGAALLGLRGNSQLLRLSLRGNSLGEAGVLAGTSEEGAGDALALASLDLDGNGLGDAGTKSLAQLMQSPSSALMQLGLTRNGIANKGAIALAAAIRSPSSRLLTLNLANNQIGAAGAVALLRALRESYTLTTLDLRKNPLSLFTVRLTPAMFRLELSCNYLFLHAFPDERWPAEPSGLADALGAALPGVEAALSGWRASPYALGPQKTDVPDLEHCRAKAERRIAAAREGGKEL